jgi:ATP synthase F0 subunit c
VAELNHRVDHDRAAAWLGIPAPCETIVVLDTGVQRALDDFPERVLARPQVEHFRLVVIGAAYGISKLASAAYEGMSRQPEDAGSIQTAMIIAAALIEGFTFYALFICSQKA